MSSKIKEYPGKEVSTEEIKQRKYASFEYFTGLEYSWSSGVAIGRFLEGLKEGIILARKCNKCGRILVPPRMYCELCFRNTDRWVKVKDTGRINTFSVSYVNADASRRDEPIIVAVIELDGASKGIGILHLIGEAKPEEIKVGMRVRAVWKEKKERTGAITDIKYFKPW